MKKSFLIIVFFISLFITTPANALPVDLFPGAGWQEFVFNAKDSFWRLPGTFDPVAYYIDITDTCYLTVTDGFLPGDQFEVFDFGVSLGLTSAPIKSEGLNIGRNFDSSSRDDQWSTGGYALKPGEYLITGTVAESPFDSGRAALRIDYFSGQIVAPEPATMLTLSLGLLGVFGLRRKQA